MSRVEMLAIGDELLDGRVADTNSLRLARRLDEVGLHLRHVAHVVDDVGEIQAGARAALARGTTLCVVSGGLGPTADDLTSQAMAGLAGLPEERDPQAAAKIEAHVRRRGRELTANQLRQADRPRGAALIDNPVGTACGFVLRHQGCDFVCLPGVPREFDHLTETAIVRPRRGAHGPIDRRALSVFGLAEAEMDHRLAPLQRQWPAVRVQFRVAFPVNHVTLWAGPADVAALDAAAAWAAGVLGGHVFSRRGASLPEVVLAELGQRGATLATAESCTGGLVGDLLTDVPGSSEVFVAGLVTYSNAAKQSLAGVRAATLAAHGAVSEAVVGEMAAGVRARAEATFGLAVSGIAGPAGGSADKPVGTVWLGLADADGARARRLQLTFERRDNKMMSAMAALAFLRSHLAGPVGAA